MEYTGLGIGTLRLDLTNATNLLDEQSRIFYAGSRAIDDVERIHQRSTRYGRSVTLSLKGAF